MPKTVYIEAWQDGELVGDFTVNAKKDRRAGLLKALDAIRDKGSIVREAENGKVWGTWHLEPGARVADKGKPVYTDWTPYRRR